MRKRVVALTVSYSPQVVWARQLQVSQTSQRLRLVVAFLFQLVWESMLLLELELGLGLGLGLHLHPYELVL